MPIAEGHLQATGLDVSNRKQYRYHPMWNELRNKTKFYRLPELGKLLPAIRQQLETDLALPGLPKKKCCCCSKPDGKNRHSYRQ